MTFSKAATRPRRSMASLAILAILMVMASYATVFLLAAVCIFLPYLFMDSAMGGIYSFAFFLFGIVIAATLLWSILPRSDKFSPPGPILDRLSQPRLFAELDDIAASLDETLPQEVYLIGGVGAWVTDRGGFMGLGSRRILGVGLPLLSVLTISELRAILAHEFAHYYAGDTSLGPWVYKTRTAIIRSFQNVEPLGEWMGIPALRVMHLLVSKILEWYLGLFLRATNWVSRRQEYRADELACLIVGSKPLVDALRAIHGTAPAWQEYWNTEVVHVLNDGRIPPIGDGFALFIKAQNISRQIEANLDIEMRGAISSPLDTHPPLRDRIEAAQKLSVTSRPDEVQSALSLLDNRLATELLFVQTVNPQFMSKSLIYVAWDEVGTRVMIPAWEESAWAYRKLFQSLTAESLPECMPMLLEMGSIIKDPTGTLLTRPQRTQRAGQLLAIGLALSLLNHGWELHTQPGELHLRRGQDQLNPFQTLERLISGELSRENWLSQCHELGISVLPLSPQEKSPDI